jgi:RND superfamily putative drug exporter
MASNIFTPDGQSNEQRAIRHRPDDDSFKRLFGANGGGGDNPDGSPRKNHQKSSIVFADAGPANGKVNGTNGHGPSNGHGVNGTNGTNGHSNGHENGTPNGNSNGIANGGSNGHVNGSNGHVNGGSNGTNGHTNGTNGHANGTNGHANGDSPKMNGSNGVHAEANGKRIPPGGYASKLW